MFIIEHINRDFFRFNICLEICLIKAKQVNILKYFNLLLEHHFSLKQNVYFIKYFHKAKTFKIPYYYLFYFYTSQIILLFFVDFKFKIYQVIFLY